MNHVWCQSHAYSLVNILIFNWLCFYMSWEDNWKTISIDYLCNNDNDNDNDNNNDNDDDNDNDNN